ELRFDSSLRLRSLFGCRGQLYRLANALVSAAAADIGFHGRVNVGVRGVWLLLEQCGGSHDLPALAVTALRHVGLFPSQLEWVGGRLAQTFNGEDIFSGHRLHGDLATADRGAVQVNRTSSA